MKKSITIFFLAIALWSCDNTSSPAEKETIHDSVNEHHERTVTGDTLTLNKGVKWKADSSTNSNVKILLSRIETFNSGTDKSLVAYSKVSGQLQQGLNKMVSDCKMQGADHEALHKWLQPVIEQVSKLKSASNAGDAAILFEAIRTQVNIYQQYFE